MRKKEKFIKVNYDVIEERRKALGFTMDYIGSKLGMNPRYYCVVKSRNACIPEFLVHRLGVILNLPADRFVGHEPKIIDDAQKCVVQKNEVRKEGNKRNDLDDAEKTGGKMKANKKDRCSRPASRNLKNRFFVKWKSVEKKRAAKEISMSSLSRKMGHSANFYSNAKSVDCQLLAEDIEKICRILDTTRRSVIDYGRTEYRPAVNKSASDTDVKTVDLFFAEDEAVPAEEPAPAAEDKAVAPSVEKDEFSNKDELSNIYSIINGVKEDISNINNKLDSVCDGLKDAAVFQNAVRAAVASFFSVLSGSQPEAVSVSTTLSQTELVQPDAETVQDTDANPVNGAIDVTSINFDEIELEGKKKEVIIQTIAKNGYKMKSDDFLKLFGAIPPKVLNEYKKELGIKNITVGYGENKTKWVVVDNAHRM